MHNNSSRPTNPSNYYSPSAIVSYFSFPVDFTQQTLFNQKLCARAHNPPTLQKILGISDQLWAPLKTNILQLTHRRILILIGVHGRFLSWSFARMHLSACWGCPQHVVKSLDCMFALHWLVSFLCTHKTLTFRSSKRERKREKERQGPTANNNNNKQQPTTNNNSRLDIWFVFSLRDFSAFSASWQTCE